MRYGPTYDGFFYIRYQWQYHEQLSLGQHVPSHYDTELPVRYGRTTNCLKMRPDVDGAGQYWKLRLVHTYDATTQAQAQEEGKISFFLRLRLCFASSRFTRTFSCACACIVASYV